jgi:hypothetical protein
MSLLAAIPITGSTITSTNSTAVTSFAEGSMLVSFTAAGFMVAVGLTVAAFMGVVAIGDPRGGTARRTSLYGLPRP